MSETLAVRELAEWLESRSLRLVLEDGQIYLTSTLKWYEAGQYFVDESLGEDFSGE